MEEKTLLQKLFWRNSDNKYKVDFILCLLLGWIGVHKFKNRKYFAGIIYVITLGLFGIGWAIDSIKLIYIAFILDDKGLEQYKIKLEEKERTKREQSMQYIYEVQTKKENIAIRKQEAQASGQACCPKCGSTSLSANKKGFGLIKGAAGVIVAGPVGVVAAGHGKNKIIVTCLNCGKQFKPGRKY